MRLGRSGRASGLRILVDLGRKDGGVEGMVSVEGLDLSARFSGWLELMALLDALWMRTDQKRGEE
ncbi:MAG TPA: hypothetical protein VFF24_07650 [Acidimicrobiia bacterium]|nr:hypothetical protein [Acidimicrobiia bacterium]